MKIVILLLLHSAFKTDTVEINYKDICGQKLHETCPNAINTKIVGGDSTCAEKVPWNVLVEKINEKSSGFLEFNCIIKLESITIN